ARSAPRIRTRWLDKLPLQSVLDQLRHLPPDSVVLYIPMQQDGSGKSASAFEVARQVADVSSVPVYGVSRPQLQQGIIGGALLDFSEIGSKTAALALRVLAGERRITIADEGVGFDPEAMRANGSLGLVSMSERARFVHGQFSIESHADK